MKWMLPSIMICVVAVGCNSNKKDQMASGVPMNGASMNVPATPAAPPAQYTPPPQPVVYDAPQDQAVTTEAVADASDTMAVAPAPARPRRAASSGGTRYKVKKGESLWTIAESKYGNGNKWKAIAAANPQINPNKVQAGQTITLP
jgi:5'-nucleotidase